MTNPFSSSIYGSKSRKEKKEKSDTEAERKRQNARTGVHNTECIRTFRKGKRGGRDRERGKASKQALPSLPDVGTTPTWLAPSYSSTSSFCGRQPSPASLAKSVLNQTSMWRGVYSLLSSGPSCVGEKRAALPVYFVTRSRKWQLEYTNVASSVVIREWN